MKYPNKIIKHNNKVINYANRGMDLENLINLSNVYYLKKDIAIINKKPTPIQIVDAEYSPKGRMITKAYFKEPSTLDYSGIYKGYHIDFDAKETSNKTSFPLNNLHDHQYEYMKKIINHGGISFLLIAINHEVYYLDGHVIIDFIENNNRKSIPFNYIKENGYKVDKKINPRLDYIKIIEELYVKGGKYGN